MTRLRALALATLLLIAQSAASLPAWAGGITIDEPGPIGQLLTEVMPQLGLGSYLPDGTVQTGSYNPFGGTDTSIDFPQGEITGFSMAWVGTGALANPGQFFDDASGLGCTPPGTQPAPGSPGVFCGAADSDPTLFQGGFDVFGFSFAGDILGGPSGRQLELALITVDPSNPNVWDPQFENDAFRMANHATVLQIVDGQPQTPIDYVLNPSGTGFDIVDSDARVALSHNAVAFFEPGVISATDVRVYSFTTPLNGGFQPDTVAAYSYPFISEPLMPIDGRQMIELIPPVAITDSCLGVDHFPDVPVGNDPSKITGALAFPREYAGAAFNVQFLEPGGYDTATGTVGDTGIGEFDLGINVFGLYPVVSGVVVDGMSAPIDPSSVGGGSISVSDPEVPCDGSMLTPQPPATTSTTSTTTSTSSTSTTSATTPASSTSVTTTTAAATTTSVATGEGGGGTSAIWWWLGGLLLVLGGGLFFFGGVGDPCAELFKRWKAAQKACEEARKRLEERKKKLREAEKGLRDAQAEYDAQDSKADDLRKQLESLKNARRSSVTYGDVTYHRIPEGLVTAEGLESIINSVQAQIDSHESNMDSWQQSVDRWRDIVKDHQKLVAEAQAEVDRLCAEAEAARKAYEDCIKQKTAPEPEPEPEDEGGGAGTGEGTGTGEGGGGQPGGPTPPGTAPPPEQPEPQPECEEGATREEEVARGSFAVPKTTRSMTLSVEPPTEEFADWMEAKLEGAGGRLSPNNLNTPGFAEEVRRQLRGLDSSLSVSHSVTVSFPRQEITYACVQHWVCRNGSWQKSHTEIREISRRDLSDQTFTETGKMDSMTVRRLVGQAQSAYQQLVRNWDRVEELCQ